MKYLALFVTFAWFYQAGGWNQNSRFDLVRAIVDEGTLRIDDYHRNTGDKARWNGHYDSDKAPGLALAAVPAVAPAPPVVPPVAPPSPPSTPCPPPPAPPPPPSP